MEGLRGRENGVREREREMGATGGGATKKRAKSKVKYRADDDGQEKGQCEGERKKANTRDLNF